VTGKNFGCGVKKEVGRKANIGDAPLHSSAGSETLLLTRTMKVLCTE